MSFPGRLFRFIACTVAALLAFSQTLSAADDPAAFYRGQTVRIIVGYGAGGGFDVYARVLARHIGSHIPGNPRVIVENMPGGGGLVAANALYNTMPKDGTVIGHVLGELALLQVVGFAPAKFDSAKFSYVGAPTPDTPVCAVRSDTHITNVGQLRNSATPLIFSGQAPGTNTDDPPNVLKAALGLKLSVTEGYEGTHAMQLAVEQGEAQGACFGWEAMKVTWASQLASKSIIPIGRSQSSDPAIHSVPEFYTFTGNSHDRDLIHYGIDAPSRFQRPFILPPGVPVERVAALRKAFDETMTDPQFLANAKTANLAVAPVTGAALQKLVADMFHMPAAIKAQLAQAILPKQ